jgi:hypothetical protein
MAALLVAPLVDLSAGEMAAKTVDPMAARMVG